MVHLIKTNQLLKNSLMKKVRSNEITIKLADKGSKVAVMAPEFIEQCTNNI